MIDPRTALYSDAQLETAIRQNQDAQKRNPPTSLAWQTASERLSALFHEARCRNLRISTPL